jgi:hypothetical protein
LPGHLLLDHPDDITIEHGDLGRGQSDTGHQAQVLLHRQGIIHQIAILGVIAGDLAGQESLAGLGEDAVADQFILVEGITQQLQLPLIRREVQATEQVIAADEIGIDREGRSSPRSAVNSFSVRFGFVI